jgi:hypothetical protein
MPKTPAEPTNLMLEQFRLMRAEVSSFRAEVNSRFDRVEADIADLKRDMRGMKLNTIAEVYKANLTVASFVDLERRVQVLESKTSP